MIDPSETEFKHRLRAAVHSRRKWVLASEVAGNLCHAVKALKKVSDPERRFDLLCDFIFEGNEAFPSIGETP